jgi:hypothetical protein
MDYNHRIQDTLEREEIVSGERERRKGIQGEFASWSNNNSNNKTKVYLN